MGRSKQNVPKRGIQEVASSSSSSTVETVATRKLPKEDEARKEVLRDIVAREKKKLLKNNKRQKTESETILDGEYYYCKALKGCRDYMEDTYAVDDGENASIFGVFDGHGGTICSEFCKETLLDMVRTHGDFEKKTGNALVSCFKSIDEICCDASRTMEFQDGTTATVAVVRRDTRKLFVANVGDSRCILIDTKGKATPLTRDHSASLPDEHTRVTKLGGFVTFTAGTHRLQGVLAVSRAIGDALLKPYATGTPELKTVSLKPSHRFLCIATDGVWDEVANDEIGEILLEHGVDKGTHEITTLALSRGSEDNLTFMAIDLLASTKKKADTDERSQSQTQTEAVETTQEELDAEAA